MITVTKQFSFCYGHHLPGYEGKCCEQHGHNSTLEVEVYGPTIGNQAPEGMYFLVLKAGHQYISRKALLIR